MCLACNMRYFKVKTGYRPDEYISIEETELWAAQEAQATGKVAFLKVGSISGNHIISILPDWNRVLGFNKDYELVGEDYLEIGKERERDYRDYMIQTQRKVEYQLMGKKYIPEIETKEVK